MVSSRVFGYVYSLLMSLTACTHSSCLFCLVLVIQILYQYALSLSYCSWRRNHNDFYSFTGNDQHFWKHFWNPSLWIGVYHQPWCHKSSRMTGIAPFAWSDKRAIPKSETLIRNCCSRPSLWRICAFKPIPKRPSIMEMLRIDIHHCRRLQQHCRRHHIIP